MAKADKIYVVVDPEEGTLVLRLDHKTHKVTGAIQSKAKSGARFNDHAEQAIAFASEFHDSDGGRLRSGLQSAYREFNAKAEKGGLFAVSVEQNTLRVPKGVKSASFEGLSEVLDLVTAKDMQG